MTFNQAWSQPGGRPCEGDLPSELVSDLVGSKRAAHPADSDGLLKVIWDWTKACGGSDTPSSAGTLDNSPALSYVILEHITICTCVGD